MRCSTTGRPILNMADAIYDDGEWISWEWINGQLHEQELAKEYPHASIEVVQIFEELVDLSMEYREITGRYLQIGGSWASYMRKLSSVSNGTPRSSRIRRPDGK